jgi:hypothetical protein
MKASAEYHPPDGWVQFFTLPAGAKFHDIGPKGQPIQYMKVDMPNGDLNAADLESGQLQAFDDTEFVYPINTGWIAEIECYGKLPDEVKAGGHRAIIAYIFRQAQQGDWRWRDEISKYLPGINVMSFLGPKSTVKWLFDRVKLTDEDVKHAQQWREALKKQGVNPDE